MVKRNYVLLLFLLILLLLLLTGLDLLLGTVRIPLSDVLRILFGGDSKDSWEYIILNFRLPKAFTAILVGAGLSLSGLMMQTLFRNPLAGPYVLGVSSGATLGVALLVLASAWILPATAGVPLPNAYGGWILASILGSGLVMLLVILVSLRVADSVSILIIGIMFGSVTGAIVSVLQYFSDPDSVHSFLVWTFGSISGVTWSQLIWMAPLSLIGIGSVFFLQKPLNALLLGENQARAIGIATKRYRLIIILLTSVLAGSITAFAGPIAFVGIAIPHLARAFVRATDHRRVIPVTALMGAMLLLICDMISQLPASNQVLPINSVTALFGAPVVIWVIVRKRKGRAILM